MSMNCETCGKLLEYPESLWYACTRHSHFYTRLCGTCLKHIPVDLRHPTDEKQYIKITFGQAYADTGSRNNCYQCTTMKQGAPVFWTEINTLEKFLPGYESIMEDLYPYYCPDHYIGRLTDGLKSGDREFIFRMGAFLHDIGQPQKALKYLIQVYETDKYYQNALYYLIRIFQDKGRENMVEKYLAQVTDENVFTWLDGRTVIEIKRGE